MWTNCTDILNRDSNTELNYNCYVLLLSTQVWQGVVSCLCTRSERLMTRDKRYTIACKNSRICQVCSQICCSHGHRRANTPRKFCLSAVQILFCVSFPSTMQVTKTDVRKTEFSLWPPCKRGRPHLQVGALIVSTPQHHTL